MTLQRLWVLPNYTTDLSREHEIKWSGPEPVPAIGTDVFIRMNQIGRGKVVSYATHGGYLGLMVYPYEPPAWWINQNGKPSPNNAALVFGAEISILPSKPTSAGTQQTS